MVYLHYFSFVRLFIDVVLRIVHEEQNDFLSAYFYH